MGWLATLWHRLREWSGDDAYDRYLAEHRGHGHALLTRPAFYRAYFHRRANRPRCCCSRGVWTRADGRVYCRRRKKSNDRLVTRLADVDVSQSLTKKMYKKQFSE